MRRRTTCKNSDDVRCLKQGKELMAWYINKTNLFSSSGCVVERRRIQTIDRA